MKFHLLKTHDAPFQAVWDGRKMFEARVNDREFAVGDILILGERSEEVECHYGILQKKTGEWYWTARTITARVTYVMCGGQYGIEEGHCVMSIDVISKNDYQDQDGAAP